LNHRSAISRQALSSLLERAQRADAAGDARTAASLLNDLHWFAHRDGELHQAVHNSDLAMAWRRRDLRGVAGQILPVLFARFASFFDARQPEFEVVEEVAAPAELVYRVLTDLPAYASWNPWVSAARGDSALGGAITVDANIGGKKMRIAHIVDVAAPGERFVWSDRGWFTLFASGRRLRWIEPTAGGARLVHRIALFRPFAWLAWALHGDSIRAGMKAETRAVAERAEALARGEGARAAAPAH
jgi:hypothetical protein